METVNDNEIIEDNPTSVKAVNQNETKKEEFVKIEARQLSNEPLKLLKCEKCEFISYFKNSLDSHNCGLNSIKFSCIGCSNIFHCTDSYRSHLKFDHKVKNDEIDLFFKESNNKNFMQSQPRSKIFIKDVQTLRKPDLATHSNAAIPNIFDSLDLTTTDDDIIDDFFACDDQIFDDEFDFDDSANLNNDDLPEIIEQPKIDSNGAGKIFVRKNLCNDEIESETQQSKIYVRSHESLTSQVIVTEQTQQPSEASTPDCIIVSSEIITPEQTGKIFIRDIETLTTPANESYINNLQPSYQPSIYVRSLDSLARSSLESQHCKISIKNMETLIEPNLMQPPMITGTPMIFDQAQNLVIHIRPTQTEENLLRYRDSSITPETLPGSSNVSTCGGNDDVIMLDDHEIPDMMNLIATSTIINTPQPTEIPQSETENLQTPERNETPNEKNVLQQLEIQSTTTNNQPMVSIPMDFCANDEVKDGQPEVKLKKKKRKKISICDGSTNSNSSNIQIVFKCSLEDCDEHFSSENLLNYHRKCHGGNAIICPECRNEDFKSFTNLHTHLWRAHKIDVDLFSCDLCDFKTPILSRLKNFHAKIHLDEKNYKCNFPKCEKSFKNSKQLANHFQIHKRKKMEKIHAVDDSSKKLRCLECNKGFSSESGLYIHSMEHKNEEKKFNCTDCEYSTNDHNSFRRHKSQHSQVHHYKCPSCDYSSIQSNTYRKHLERQHPELAESLLFKCNFCKFTTISKGKYEGHLVKHCDESDVDMKKNTKLKLKSDLNIHEQQSNYKKFVAK